MAPLRDRGRRTTSGLPEAVRRPRPFLATELPCRDLAQNLTHHTSADGLPAFADREAQLLMHRNRGGSTSTLILALSPGMHMSASDDLSISGHIRGPEVELRAVTMLKKGE